MPRPELDHDWQEAIFAQAAEHAGRGGAFIRARLVEAYGDVSGLPTPKTIDKYVRRFKELRPDVQHGYRVARWPASFQEGLLPWEAAPVMFEFMREYNSAP